MSKIKRDIEDSIRIYREMQETFHDGEGNVLIELFIMTLTQISEKVEREHRQISAGIDTEVEWMQMLTRVKEDKQIKYASDKLGIIKSTIDEIISGDIESCPIEGV